MIDFAEIIAARGRLAGHIHRTPVLSSRSLDRAAGCQVFCKAENLQRGGAFKIRGAMNRLLQLTPAEREHGVVAFSSGNHAQAVALACRDLAVSAVLVMPVDAPRQKIAAVRDFGGRVVLYDRAEQNREALAREMVAREGRVLIPPYDDPAIIAGAATAALELLEDVPDLDALIAPVGGGGLLAGSILSAAHLRPGLAIFGVEPETAADVKLSLAQGRICSITENPTIADGLRTQQPGQLTFPILQSSVREIFTVRDSELLQTLRFFLERLKTLAEPSGLAAAAAVLRGELKNFRRVGLILSGGNVDAEIILRAFRGC